MNIFDYRCYKSYVNDFIKLRAHNGRGQYLKISKFLGVHSTMVSHIFKKDKELTMEHGLKVSEYLGLTGILKDYFMLLIQIARSGDYELTSYLESKRLKLIKESRKVSSRINANKELKEQDKALFYSSWLYSGVRLLSSIKKYQNKDELMNLFDISNKRFNEVYIFLIEKGLIVKSGENKIKMGPAMIHLDSTSPLIYRHHQNWRTKGFDRYEKLSDDELMFTAPLTISKKDIPKVREEALNFIENVKSIVEKTSPTELMCLNIDWFKVE